MPDLRIDLAATPALIASLARWADRLGRIADAVADGCASVGLISAAPQVLRLAGSEAADIADLVGTAHRRAVDFRLPSMGPVRSVAASPAWNQVQQPSSHNTYRLQQGVAEAHDRGFRSYELDLHTGRPTDPTALFDRLSWPGLAAVSVEPLADAQSRPADWHVYHHSLDSDSAYPTLSVALDEVVALPADVGGPMTIFLDLKDPLAGTHSADALDRLLGSALGDRLFTPADLLDRAPTAGSLGEAVLIAGWPTVAELDGLILVVLTDRVDAYRRRPVGLQQAFVATELTLETYRSHDIVFFNEASSRISRSEVDAIAARASLLRTWGPPDEDGLGANYVAID